MAASALFTGTVGKQSYKRSGAAGEIKPLEPIAAGKLYKDKGFHLLVKSTKQEPS